MMGGSFAAILLNIPGTPSASATGFDGYPMAARGEAGRALGIAILFLPAMSWLGVAAEFVMANGAAIRASFIMRILLPGSTLLIAATYLNLTCGKPV